MVAADLVPIANRVVIPVEAPARVLVIPWGSVESTAGDFVVDAESAATIVAAFEAHEVMIPIDLEHQTVGGKYASPDGSAPAMGWINKLEAVEDEGIYAHIEWTQDGVELVQSKKYRYFSPTLLIPKGEKKPVELHSVALTNKPAIVGMHPIVNKDEVTHMDAKFDKARWFLNLEELATEEEILMKMEEFLAQLRELAGAAESADQAAVLSALKQKLGDVEAAGEFRAAVCKSLGVITETQDEALLAAIRPRGKDGSATEEMVPRKEFDDLAAAHKKLADKNAELETRVNAGDADTRIKSALEAGWLTSHMLEPDEGGKNYYRTLAQDPEQWEAWKKRAPKVAPHTGRLSTTAPQAGAGGSDRLSAIARAMTELETDSRLIACSRKEYINECLREQGHKPLSEDEVRVHAA